MGGSIPSETGTSDSDTFFISAKSWWTSLWKLQVPAKIKVFMWKACNDMLPLFEALGKRKIPVSKLCPMCKWKNESILYNLWGCRCLKPMRNFWSPKMAGNHKGKLHFFAFIIGCVEHLNFVELGLFCVCLWKVWAIRNASVS